MRLLVISSCTRDKRHKSPTELAEPDFLDSAHLARREQELRHLSCPAGEMYTGRQHLLVRHGLGLLRRAGVQADLAIVSAGYGLIPEDRVIAPYNVTFTGKTPATVRRLADRLGIPAAVRAAIRPYPLVFFLLGDRYLTAVDPPVPSGPGQRLIFFTRPGDSRLEGPGVTVVPTGRELYRTYGANEISLKGAMFLALGRDPGRCPGQKAARPAVTCGRRAVSLLWALGSLRTVMRDMRLLMNTAAALGLAVAAWWPPCPFAGPTSA